MSHQQQQDEIKFIFLDTTNKDEESEEMEFAADLVFDKILYDAAEQFGFESGAVVDGTENIPDCKVTIDRNLTAAQVFQQYGSKIRIIYTGPE